MKNTIQNNENAIRIKAKNTLAILGFFLMLAGPLLLYTAHLFTLLAGNFPIILSLPFSQGGLVFYKTPQSCSRDLNPSDKAVGCSASRVS